MELSKKCTDKKNKQNQSLGSKSKTKARIEAHILARALSENKEIPIVYSFLRSKIKCLRYLWRSKHTILRTCRHWNVTTNYSKQCKTSNFRVQFSQQPNSC